MSQTKPDKTTIWQTLRIFWRFTRPRKGYFWGGTLGAALAVIIQDILPPIVIAKAFDLLQTYTDSGKPITLDPFLPYLYTYFGLMVAGIVLWRIQVILVWMYEIRALRDISVHIFDHLQRMGLIFHSNRFGGGLVSQTNKFLSAYERIMDEFTWSITTGVVAFTTSLIVLIATYPPFALLFAILSGAYFVIMYLRTMHTMPLDRELAASESDRTAKLADMITNVSTVTTYAQESHEKKLFEQQADLTATKYWKLLRRVTVNDTMSHVMTSGLNVVAFAAGILAITTWNQPAGVLFLAVNYTMQITRRLWEFNRVLRNLNRSFGDATDMTHILNLTPDITDTPDATPMTVNRGDIRFEHVVFAYVKGKTPLFKGMDLHIKQGEKVGLVGHSGGGKTTITKLLLRLVDIDDGRILVDGHDITKHTQESLRSAIAYVPQEPMLFHRSLADNITYGNHEASQKKIETVAKMSHAHQFITELPEGYDTLVGERGVKLSGGQRQRIAIARAMLKNAPILVLDEATSALDSKSELLIQEALWKLMEGRTAIVIAHRLSTIQKMDRIIVLEHGRIAEQGSHKELIRSGGVYAQLWAHQSGGFIEE